MMTKNVSCVLRKKRKNIFYTHIDLRKSLNFLYQGGAEAARQAHNLKVGRSKLLSDNELNNNIHVEFIITYTFLVLKQQKKLFFCFPVNVSFTSSGKVFIRFRNMESECWINVGLRRDVMEISFSL